MPRARRQPLTPGDQAYGEKQRLDNALNETPGARDMPSGGPGGPVPVPTPPMPQQVPPGVLQAAAQMEPPTGSPFDGPSRRPNEPITAGLPIGAGPGPEAMIAARPDPVATMFTALGDATGDPLMYELASRAQNYGG